MALDRAIDRIDHIQCAPRRAAFRYIVGFDVQREELSGHAAFFHARDAGAIWRRWRPTEIVIVIRHPGRDVVVRVDDDCASMNRERFLPECFIASGTRRWHSFRCGLFRRRFSLRGFSSALRTAWDCEREERKNKKQ